MFGYIMLTAMEWDEMEGIRENERFWKLYKMEES